MCACVCVRACMCDVQRFYKLVRVNVCVYIGWCTGGSAMTIALIKYLLNVLLAKKKNQKKNEMECTETLISKVMTMHGYGSLLHLINFV